MNLKGIRFIKSPKKSKKYRAILPNGSKVDFGSSSFQHFKDSVPKSQGGGIWSHMDHNDKERRKNYRKRHSAIRLKDGSRAIDKIYSPAFFSYYLLW